MIKQASTGKQSAVLRVARKLDRKRAEKQPPRIDSFADFLTHHARVKSGSGYMPYHFAGREALRPIVDRLDQILASGETDASLAICGGAQFGKTVLMLNLLAYLVAVRFRNVGYYLPDDDLVSGLVDGKLRPDVLDQIPWLSRLIAVGKTLSASGRAVNRKGAFLCTDGTRTALAFMRGLGKIPTSFSMDVVVQDEKDDLSEEHARFLAGRMTASNLRLSLLIGTQRYHGAGQNLAFTEGTQHIGLLACPGCGARHNPETLWPGICRLELPDRIARDDTIHARPDVCFGMSRLWRGARPRNSAMARPRPGSRSPASLELPTFAVADSRHRPAADRGRVAVGDPRSGTYDGVLHGPPRAAEIDDAIADTA
jgi:hypothetical protein